MGSSVSTAGHTSSTRYQSYWTNTAGDSDSNHRGSGSSLPATKPQTRRVRRRRSLFWGESLYGRSRGQGSYIRGGKDLQPLTYKPSYSRRLLPDSSTIWTLFRLSDHLLSVEPPCLFACTDPASLQESDVVSRRTCRKAITPLYIRPLRRK